MGSSYSQATEYGKIDILV